MHFFGMLMAALLSISAALAFPLLEAEQPAGNVSLEAKKPPIFSSYICHPNFAPGPRLTPEKGVLLGECYELLLAGRWVNERTRCPGTDKYFRTLGHNWRNPDHCTHACRVCFDKAIDMGAPNMHCYRSLAFLAECRVQYGNID